MAGLLLAEIKDQSASSKATAILAAAALKYGGTVSGLSEKSSRVSFSNAALAVECALEAQRLFAEYNRGAQLAHKISFKFGAHAGDDGEIPAQMLEKTPAGRIFASPAIYSQARERRVCAYIPAGTLFEVIPAVGGAPNPLIPAAGEAETKPLSPLMLAAIASAAFALFRAERGVLGFLGFFDLLNYLFHKSGHAIFGMIGNHAPDSFGGLLLQVMIPAAVFLYFSVKRRHPLSQNISLFWLGQNILSFGGNLVLKDSEYKTCIGCANKDLLTALKGMGALAHYHGIGQAAAFIGCFLIALSLGNILRKVSIKT